MSPLRLWIMWKTGRSSQGMIFKNAAEKLWESQAHFLELWYFLVRRAIVPPTCTCRCHLGLAFCFFIWVFVFLWYVFWAALVLLWEISQFSDACSCHSWEWVYSSHQWIPPVCLGCTNTSSNFESREIHIYCFTSVLAVPFVCLHFTTLQVSATFLSSYLCPVWCSLITFLNVLVFAYI